MIELLQNHSKIRFIFISCGRSYRRLWVIQQNLSPHYLSNLIFQCSKCAIFHCIMQTENVMEKTKWNKKPKQAFLKNMQSKAVEKQFFVLRRLEIILLVTNNLLRLLTFSVIRDQEVSKSHEKKKWQHC